MGLTQSRAQLGADIILLVATMQRVLDKLVAVLEQIGAELPARARQIVQCVEIELASKLSDYTAMLSWLAYIRARSRVLV